MAKKAEEERKKKSKEIGGGGPVIPRPHGRPSLETEDEKSDSFAKLT